MVARPCSSSRLSCEEHLLLRCDGYAGNSFPTTQGMDPSPRARRRKRGSSGCGGNSRASSRVETGMSGNFLSCSKGVKELLESHQGSQSSSRVGARTCAFLPSCSSSVALPFAWIKESVAFPRGFPTRLSHRAVPRATVVSVDPRLESRGSAWKTGFPGMD